MRLYASEERHAVGGPGTFLLGTAESLADTLRKEYGGSVRLIYLDPPFRTGESFSMRIGRGKSAVSVQLYEDKLSDDAYVEWMRGILSLCHDLLDSRGSLYLHLDYRMSARMRIVLDEIFGAANFMNEIVWTYKSGGRSKRYFPRKHDTILFYRKSRSVLFNIAAVGIPRGAERRNHMKRFIDEDGRIGFSIRSNGKLYKYYEDSLIYPSDVWNDIEHLQQKDRERTGYATQKPEALLRRIIGASSEEGDLVLDLFSGSGTTAAVAAKMGRRFVAVDSSPVAAYILRKRLLSISGAPDLFKNVPHELALRFPADNARCSIACDVGSKGSVRYVTVSSATFADDPAPIVYAATGRMQGQTFLAQHTNCAPKFPLKLPLPTEDVPVLELADARGRTAFFALSEAE
ncbi:MAG: site-specific DNA-methyltransferase [Clostridia bacterium]|nr:site-specific DNA-methyltransferase [Clostridia bacterium]